MTVAWSTRWLPAARRPTSGSNPRTGTSAPAFDAQALADAMNLANPDAKRPADAAKLPPLQIKREADGRLRLATAAGTYRCATEGCTSVPTPDTGSEPGSASPDGKHEAFIRNGNLWLRDVVSGKESQLTSDAKPDFGYATNNAGWVHDDKAIVLWSPDSKKIATFQQDQRKTSTMTLVATNIGAPRVEQWKYPFVGDENVTMIERVIIDLSAATPQTIRLQMPPDQHRSTCSDDIACSNGWEDVQWANDGKTLAFVSTGRGHKSATLRVADARTGAVRDVFEETVATQYQSAAALDSVNWRYLPESNEFLWFSQKSDWGHLYLHDLATGKLKRQITSGDWNVTQIEHLDPASRTIWFRGVGREAGRDPYFQHFYKVGMDAGDASLLTPDDANHSITMADDGRYFVDTYSTIATAPVSRAA